MFIVLLQQNFWFLGTVAMIEKPDIWLLQMNWHSSLSSEITVTENTYFAPDSNLQRFQRAVEWYEINRKRKSWNNRKHNLIFIQLHIIVCVGQIYISTPILTDESIHTGYVRRTSAAAWGIQQPHAF